MTLLSILSDVGDQITTSLIDFLPYKAAFGCESFVTLFTHLFNVFYK